MSLTQRARQQVQRAVGQGSTGVIVGLVAVAVLTVIFIRFSDEVVERDYTHIDRAIALWIHGGASPTQTAIMLVVTNFGMYFVFLFAALSLIIGGYIAWRAGRHRSAGVAVAVLDTVAPAVAVLGAAIISTIIKDVVGRSRPHIFPPLGPAAGPSFPSGHTLTAVAFYSMCAFLLARPLHGWARAGIYAAAALIIGTVAYSRIYLGVHYPTDVLGSFIIGAAWVIALIITLQVVENHLKGAHLIRQRAAEDSTDAATNAPAAPDSAAHSATQ